MTARAGFPKGLDQRIPGLIPLSNVLVVLSASSMSKFSIKFIWEMNLSVASPSLRLYLGTCCSLPATTSKGLPSTEHGSDN